MKNKIKSKITYALAGTAAFAAAAYGFAAYGSAAAFASGEAKTTVMVYMIGSDLESQGGAATSDLEEMVSAKFGDGVNVIVQTGGASQWYNNIVTADSLQRYELETGGMRKVDEVRRTSMTKPSTLSSFISWAAKNYPAERYDLVLWDHGGGTLCGYGSDEFDQNNTLELNELSEALSAGGVKFDFIGFDACLMATVENAYMLSNYADYLIASEESEPGFGWYYTGWLTMLGKDPQVDTVQLGTKIVNDYMQVCNSENQQGVLSVIDLSKVKSVYDNLCTYMGNSAQLIVKNEFAELSQARANARAYGEGQFDQIDIIDYASKISDVDASALENSVKDCVLYVKGNISGSNGLAMYYPYTQLGYYNMVSSDLDSYGYTGYEEYFNQFVSVLAGAQMSDAGNQSFFQGGTIEIPESESTSPTQGQSSQGQNEQNGQNFDVYSWFDEVIAELYGDQYTDTASNYDELEIQKKGDEYVLSLSEKDWSLITYIEQVVYYDDGEGYIELGNDDYYQTDDDGDLLVDYDYEWVAINGMIVPFYAAAEDYESDNWYSYGYVNAVLNEKSLIEILVRWDAQHPDGYVGGWRYSDSSDGTSSLTPAAKGYFDFKEGDKIDIISNYYDYNGNFKNSYYWGDQIVVGSEDLTASYEAIGDGTVVVYYHLKDVYQNDYYTPTLEFSLQD